LARIALERLIVDPDLPLLDMALLLGFAEQSAFSRAFRRWFGAPPREYRAALRR
jgi:AraC-like DNA-binding protein